MVKVYAVRKGRKTGIYKTWEETKRLVNGYSCAEYKSFEGKTKEEARELAQQYLTGEKKKKKEKIDLSGVTTTKSGGKTPKSGSQYSKIISGTGKNWVVAYTDGSYNDKNGKTGAAYVYFSHSIKGVSTYFTSVKGYGMRQIAGELEAVLKAIERAIAEGKEGIEIRYDYTGVEGWATGNWSAKNEVTKRYKDTIERYRKRIKIKFLKVEAHSSNPANDLADYYSKKACGKV